MKFPGFQVNPTHRGLFQRRFPIQLTASAAIRTAVLFTCLFVPGASADLSERFGRLDLHVSPAPKDTVIVYESLPKFFVTANLYIPSTGEGPFPAVFYAVGHGQAGKAFSDSQTLSVGFVKRGYVVLTIDPIGQGERSVYFDERLETSVAGRTSSEHQMVGLQGVLAGESLARYMIWDAMRGIDLLASWPEADPERIGITCSETFFDDWFPAIQLRRPWLARAVARH